MYPTRREPTQEDIERMNVEYGLLIALVAVVAIAGIILFGQKWRDEFIDELYRQTQYQR